MFRKIMQLFPASIVFIFVINLLPVLADNTNQTKEKQTIRLKFATLAPAGSLASEGLKTVQKCFDSVEKNLNVKTKIVGYFSGSMGNDAEMIKKAKRGELDMLAVTMDGLSLISKEFEIFNMPYLIENYGMLDYVLKQNASAINKIFFDNGWVSIALLISEGQDDLYVGNYYDKLQDFQKNIKAANYAGLSDEMFFKALNIAQIPVELTDIQISAKKKIINGAILPSVLVMGMQVYSTMPYLLKPSVRIATSGLIMTKRSWEMLPWEARLYLAVMQPTICYGGSGLMRDASYAFTEALLRNHIKQIKLSDAEYKEWLNNVVSYRSRHMADRKSDYKLYDQISKSIKEYKETNSAEKRIFEKDSTYRRFPEKIDRVGEAMLRFLSTNDKSNLLNLERDAVIERWRIYDCIDASEYYIKSGDNFRFKAWMKSYYIPEVTDELFGKHAEVVKKMYGEKNALKDRIYDAIEAYKIIKESIIYQGFQRKGLKTASNKI